MHERRLWAPADPLGEALHFLRMSGTFYCRSELSEPFALTMPPMPGCLWFHVVTTGRCQLTAKGLSSVQMLPGDFTLIPHGLGHRLGAGAKTRAPVVLDLPHEMVGERYALLRHGGGGAPTTLICGVVRFDHPAVGHLLEMLPPVLHLSATSSPQSAWMESTLGLMAAEAMQLRPGGETIVTRLADILVVQAIRAWIQSDPAARTGWLGALQDPQIGRAMLRIHRDPGAAWTVAGLAAAAAMSRSAFSARFTDLVGEPPMQYVTRQRMKVAVSLLAEEQATLAELAGRLGYRSEAAFSRAFKRSLGTAPGALRRERARPLERR